ncbi:alkaline phosphatase [Cohnella xylanilytica]|uniref:DedA family protein n=1 Tax=Cohnella xylanilytica TaxID=557555 RepID=A0A841U7W7_9BACL|nr:DedA family protein [Cohnella xylanilytica]MBB6695762.1 DedA family protein [Cohnella xylanilytica]GIO15498.1 alkaline phosphatase [Cohnella xylanilytica]
MKLLELIESLFAHYGYLVLLIGLPLDAIALPIPPGNTTLTYTGYLSFKGILSLPSALAAAFAGAAIGMTVTYWIGYKLGMPLIERYGKWLLLKPEYLTKTRRFYDKYGNRLLLFSCFIPGVRQFIGYFAGIVRVPYRDFALYGYAGSALWVLAFVGVGYLFGEQWQLAFRWLEQSLKYLSLGVAAALVLILSLKWRGRRLRARLDKLKGEADG